MIMQAVCDHRGVFWDVNIGSPGCTPDCRVLRCSNLRRNIDTILGNTAVDVCGSLVTPYLLGDSGYVNTPWLMAPYPGQAYTAPHDERRFNYAHSSARNVIERAFGQLKHRWRCLLLQLNHRLSIIPHVIMSCVILHNWLKMRGEPDVLEDEDEVEILPPEVAEDMIDNDDVAKAKRDLLADYVNLKWNSIRKQPGVIQARRRVPMARARAARARA